MQQILRIDSGAYRNSSITRQLGDELTARLLAANPGTQVTTRETGSDMPLLDQNWLQSNQADASARTVEQQQALEFSDRLIEEIKCADALVITAPVYNFSLPAALKAWIDMICRAGETFDYSAEGPVGKLADKPVYVIMASGGMPFGSEADFASGYLKHVLGFIGITDVRFVLAQGTNIDAQSARQQALTMMEQWLPQNAAAVA